MGRLNKGYLIVSNDIYEFPLTKVYGAEKASDVLGMTVNQFRHRLMRDSWNGKYKAVVDGFARKKRKKNGKKLETRRA